MHTYITNLKISIDRKQHMERQLKRTNLSYEFFDCVIGDDLTEAEITAKCDTESIEKQNEKVNWFTRGVIGCTMTNQNIYRDIINRNLEYVLFLEDDTWIPDNLAEILDDIEPNIVQGDVILLFWKAFRPLEFTTPVFSIKGDISFYIPVKHNNITGGSAYIVTKKAAQKMIDANTPIQVPPDKWTFFCRNNCIDRLICAYPRIIDTANFKSTMRAGNFLYIREFINDQRVFPFYQLLKYWRIFLKKRTEKVIFIK